MESSELSAVEVPMTQIASSVEASMPTRILLLLEMIYRDYRSA